MKSGGTSIACSSVLKEVSISQPSGKNSSSAATHAPRVRSANERKFSDCMPMPSVEVLADDADQEGRHDVGQHHREQRPCRSHADVEVHQRLLEDQVGEIGALVARSAV